MQVASKIDHLKTELSKLKPTLSDDRKSNEKKFQNLLTSSLENDSTVDHKDIDIVLSKNAKLESDIPEWVDPNYRYDPLNPRKPNMREMIEAMSGKNVEDLYKDSKENWQKICRQASEILNGVVGSNEDTRDWVSIMASDNILVAAREQTGVMYKPEVDIQSNFNDDGILTKQFAIIKDSKGNTLRSLSSDITSTEETLLNFGATKASIPTNIEKLVDPEKFDDTVLSFLKNFDNKSTTIQQIVLQSASEVIANKLSQEIPLDELAKL